ncbi:hypothetical protein Tco_0520881 [Tanacetum coccineum]
MTESELEERRARGLCFRCEEKFKPGHRCAPHTLQVMIVDDSDAENEPYLQIKAEVNAKMEEALNTNNLANDVNEHKLGHRPIKLEQANRRIAEDEREAEVNTISSQPK